MEESVRESGRGRRWGRAMKECTQSVLAQH